MFFKISIECSIISQNFCLPVFFLRFSIVFQTSPRCSTSFKKVYNFGTGKGSSVLDVIKSFEKQTKFLIYFRFTKRRKGDVPISYCCTKKAFKELNWKAKHSLSQAMMDIKKII